MHEHGDDHSRERIFSTEAAGLPDAVGSWVVDVSGDDAFDLRIAPVAKRLDDAIVRMLAYNGSIPGPTLRVREGSEIVVNVTNDADLDATVHWHGVRLDNRYDGTHETQAPIRLGETFTYRIEFPDPGVYWYHPHIREDYGQEMGLYGNILVVPADPGYWGPVHREVLLTLDDVLVEDGRIAPFSRVREHPHRHGAVRQRDAGRRADGPQARRPPGRGGAPLSHQHRQHPGVQRRDRGRANQARGRRQRALRARGARRSGPARARRSASVVDVLFDQPGEQVLEHHTPDRSYRLAADQRGRGARDAVAGTGVRGAAQRPGARGRARTAGVRARRRAGQDHRFRGGDGHGHPGGRGRLRLPDAPRGREAGAGPLPDVRDEADADGARGPGSERRRRAAPRSPARAGEHSTSTPMARRGASSGRTTWSRSTG